MKRSGSIRATLLVLAFFPGLALAQGSAGILQKELDEIKQQHNAIHSKNADDLLSTLQTASATPDAAEKLYLAAGGTLPDSARVVTKYEHETPSEETARTAIDHAVLGAFDTTLQLHCGMMRFAILFVTQPTPATLPDEWTAWLKEAGPAYPQIMVDPKDSRPDRNPSTEGGHHHRDKEAGSPSAPTAQPKPRNDPISLLRLTTMQASPIGAFLGFHAWGDQEQAKWRVADLPKLYFDKVLTPLRAKPTADTLAAWDVYIGMMNADATDADKLTDIDYPDYQFERTCDDYAVTPGTEKLEALLALIKAHLDHPKFDTWVERVHALLQASGPKHADAASRSSPVEATLPPIQPDQPPPPSVGTPR